MKRDLQAMAATEHDVVVVGGGVTGACIARDAAMRGLRVALLEKGDFCHGTSAASSKLIHGGLRYLRNFELGLVRESLRERRIWEVIAPHLVYPLRTLMPVLRRRGSPSKLLLRVGLTLYDLLGFDRNQLDDADKRIPGHHALAREAALRSEPGLPTADLVGAIVYYDCQMYSPERLCLEQLVDADARGARLANYAEVTSFVVEDAAVRGVEVRDVTTGERVTVRGRVTVNASGPWADRLLARVPGAPSSTHIVRSKGIHLVTRPLTRESAVVVEHKGGHFFLLPWRGHSLIGTTDTIYEGEPDAFGVTEQDIVEFLATINAGYPSAKLRREDVLYFYGGMRPLVESTGGEEEDTYDASRRSEIQDHARTDGLESLVSALGGKWTTSRHLAEQVVDMLGRKLGRRLPACATDLTPLPGGGTGAWGAYLEQARREHEALPAAIVDELVRNYGSRYGDVLARGEEDPALLRPLGPGRPEVGAQVAHAVDAEMALRLDDVVFRRTGLGTLGDPGDAALGAAADTMGEMLGWDSPERERQIARVRARYVPSGGAPPATEAGG